MTYSFNAQRYSPRNRSLSAGWLLIFAILASVVMAISMSHHVHATPSDGQDFETTNPGLYPTWTIVDSRVEETIKDEKHMARKTGMCASGGSGTRTTTNRYYEFNYNFDHSGGTYKLVRTTTKKEPTGQAYCDYNHYGAYTLKVKVKTTYYTMRLIPFAYTPATTVDKPTSKPGDVITFSHRITSTGTPPAAVNPPTLATLKERSGPTYNYGYNTIKELLCKLNPSSCYADSRDVLLPTYTGKTRTYDTKITIGKDTPEGAKICYSTRVDPRDQAGGTATSSQACTTVSSAPSNTTQFNLIPSISLEAVSPAEAGELVTMSDRVQNTMKDTSPETTWTGYAVQVKSGVDTAPVTGSTHDDKTPAQLADTLGKQPNGQPNATLVPASDTAVNKTGKATIGGSTTVTVGTRSFVLPDDAPVGTKFCFFLSVTPAASSGTPTTRTSAGKCMTIGKKPKLNVYGGDLSVGRKFNGDTTVPNLLGSSIHTSLSVKNEEGKRTIYGSWTEYDAYAPGTVSGFGTASGLQGGLAAPTTDQSLWSKLTFVNVKNTFGSFSSSNTLGTIPDTAAAVTAGLPVARVIPTETTDLDLGTNNTGLTSGIYRKDTGDLALKGTTLAPGKTVVVAAPQGTVTIDGDLRYAGGPYTSLSQIPQLLIIAKNIVIRAPVTTVDAWLIAKAPLGASATSDPSVAAGRITTCDATGNLSTNICNQPLTVTGPVMSNQLVLRRTAGLADPKESDRPAETFNLRADSYLWIYQQGTSNLRALTTYNRELPVRF